MAAAWFGFLFAGYSAVANDSIQTLGTYIASNSHRPWWILWLFMGLILVLTLSYSWVVYDGDVSYQRLSSKGFEHSPTSFNYFQIIAPVVLLVITRFKMPVSTTFLLLSSFANDSKGVTSILEKSLYGYLIAFTVSMLVWGLLHKLISKLVSGKMHPAWDIAQWISSGTLWAVWIMQDAANIAVYLPRQLDTSQFVFFTAFLFAGLALLFYLRGDKIQNVVDEKSGVSDIRSATLIDFVYAVIMIYFTKINTVPMSTTWVFIGLLGGRELAINLTKNTRSRKEVISMISMDILRALIGLAISIILALLANPVLQKEFLGI